MDIATLTSFAASLLATMWQLLQKVACMLSHCSDGKARAHDDCKARACNSREKSKLCRLPLRPAHTHTHTHTRQFTITWHICIYMVEMRAQLNRKAWYKWPHQLPHQDVSWYISQRGCAWVSEESWYILHCGRSHREEGAAGCTPRVPSTMDAATHCNTSKFRVACTSTLMLCR
jgi:hypothetical protein